MSITILFCITLCRSFHIVLWIKRLWAIIIIVERFSTNFTDQYLPRILLFFKLVDSDLVTQALLLIMSLCSLNLELRLRRLKLWSRGVLLVWSGISVWISCLMFRGSAWNVTFIIRFLIVANLARIWRVHNCWLISIHSLLLNFTQVRLHTRVSAHACIRDVGGQSSIVMRMVLNLRCKW